MRINPNEIHIWSAILTLSPEQEHEKLALLSVDERERAYRFHFAIHRQRYIASRSQLRQILSLYLDTPPQDLVFAYTAHQKPYLQLPSHSRLQFNLSHSENMGVYAFTLDYAIGVDIEKIQDTYQAGLATRFFNAEENRRLQQIPALERIAEFYRIWSRKEALIKAVGKGLSIPLSSFSVVDNASPDVIMLEDKQWSLAALSITPGYQSAVATDQSIKTISYWIFPEHQSSFDSGII